MRAARNFTSGVGNSKQSHEVSSSGAGGTQHATSYSTKVNLLLDCLHATSNTPASRAGLSLGTTRQIAQCRVRGPRGKKQPRHFRVSGLGFRPRAKKQPRHFRVSGLGFRPRAKKQPTKSVMLDTKLWVLHHAVQFRV